MFTWKQSCFLIVTWLSFFLTTQASEVVDPSSNSTAVVLITVLDTNDNSPQFLQNSYHFNIREDLALPGYIVTDRFNVQDKDIYVSTRIRNKKLFNIKLSKNTLLKDTRNLWEKIKQAMSAAVGPQLHCHCV